MKRRIIRFLWRERGLGHGLLDGVFASHPRAAIVFDVVVFGGLAVWLLGWLVFGWW